MTQLSKVLAIAPVITAFFIATSSALALSQWEEERAQGIRFEFAKNFSAALPHYLKALALAPNANANLQVQLQSQIATCYMHQEKRLKALPYIDSLLVSASSLRAKGALKADTEMYLVALVEECESNHSSLASKAKKEWLEYMLLSQRICDAAVPSLATPDMQAKRARCFLALGDAPGALKYLNAYMLKLPPSDHHYLEMQLRQAALKNLLHQPEMLRNLSQALARTRPPVEVACLIGDAQTWATDYSAAEKTLFTLYDKLDKQKKLSRVDRINLLNTRLYNSLDCGRWPEAEQLAKQCLALRPPERIRNLCLTALSVSLARQGKGKDAAKYERQKRDSTYSFLADEERDAAAETVKRRARK